MEINAFTDWRTLGDLICDYNKNEKVITAGLQIDNKLAKIRDLLAHGRVLGDNPEPPMHIYKFYQPKKNDTKVKVEFNAVMDEEGLKKTTTNSTKLSE